MYQMVYAHSDKPPKRSVLMECFPTLKFPVSFSTEIHTVSHSSHNGVVSYSIYITEPPRSSRLIETFCVN